MSDLQNPIFEDEKEFLERQRLEYKNALISEVTGLKNQTTQYGKGALLLGGALAGVWMVSKLVSGGKKKKKKKKKKAALKMLQSQSQNPQAGFYLPDSQPTASQPAPGEYAASPVTDDEVNFGSALDFNQPKEEGNAALYSTPAKFFNPEVKGSNYALHNHYYGGGGSGARSQSFLHSEFAKTIATQAMAFLLVYLSKKAEEYLTKNHDIATQKGTETHDADFSYQSTDAGKHL